MPYGRVDRKHYILSRPTAVENMSRDLLGGDLKFQFKMLTRSSTFIEKWAGVAG